MCTNEDKGKLRRVVHEYYLPGGPSSAWNTLVFSISVAADNLGIMQTWVDTSCAVHPDMKSHTGGFVCNAIIKAETHYYS